MKKILSLSRLLSSSLLALFALAFLAGGAFAAGSATVSWVPPTTDEGGGELTGLDGYKVLYDTSSHWASSCSKTVGNQIDVPGGSRTSYYFENTLTPGTKYYFTVVAYDGGGNISACAKTSGGATEVSKVISYTADIENSDTMSRVNLADFGIFRANWNQTNCDNIANFVDRDGSDGTPCKVNLSDFQILRDDFGRPALTPAQ